MNLDTLQGTNISHLGKAGKSSTQKYRLVGDMDSFPSPGGYSTIRLVDLALKKSPPNPGESPIFSYHGYHLWWRLVSEHVLNRGQICNLENAPGIRCFFFGTIFPSPNFRPRDFWRLTPISDEISPWGSGYKNIGSERYCTPKCLKGWCWFYNPLIRPYFLG